jgi:hypothetical protein
MINTNQRRLTTRHYDLADHSLIRMLRQTVRFWFVPVGNFGGGANLFFVLRLLAWRTTGRGLARLAPWLRRAVRTP